jgi:hypothetical protein
VPDGAGGLVAQPFAPPQTGVTLLRLLQSVLVHLNLLVLPMLILAKGGSRD